MKIKQISENFNFQLAFQGSQTFEINPLLKLVGSECKHLSRLQLLAVFLVVQILIQGSWHVSLTNLYERRLFSNCILFYVTATVGLCQIPSEDFLVWYRAHHLVKKFCLKYLIVSWVYLVSDCENLKVWFPQFHTRQATIFLGMFYFDHNRTTFSRQNERKKMYL